jgi:hypothetical protein
MRFKKAKSLRIEKKILFFIISNDYFNFFIEFKKFFKLFCFKIKLKIFFILKKIELKSFEI